MYDTAATSNHTLILVKTISLCYLKIKLHHLAKKETEKLQGKLVRKSLNKLILFKNQ
jgi:hypothetical protein